MTPVHDEPWLRPWLTELVAAMCVLGLVAFASYEVGLWLFGG